MDLPVGDPTHETAAISLRMRGVPLRHKSNDLTPLITRLSLTGPAVG